MKATPFLILLPVVCALAQNPPAAPAKSPTTPVKSPAAPTTPALDPTNPQGMTTGKPVAIGVPMTGSDPVVVTIEGRPYKKSEMEILVRALPDNITKNYYTNKKAWFQQFALMIKLTSMAEKDGIDKEFPHQQRLAFNRLQYLATAMLGHEDNSITVSPDEVKTYYDAHQSEFARAKVKVLYVAFNNKPPTLADSNVKRTLTEAEAKAKIDGLSTQLKSGADFVKLVKENSDDAESKAKDGDFGTFRPTDKTLPAEVKATIFQLKPGQVSEPVRQPNGFYLFKLEEMVQPSFTEAQAEIGERLKREKFDLWVRKVQQDVSIVYNDEAYLTAPPVQ
jgi:peptidyl-prolyl cis-trans isomerase C